MYFSNAKRIICEKHLTPKFCKYTLLLLGGTRELRKVKTMHHQDFKIYVSNEFGPMYLCSMYERKLKYWRPNKSGSFSSKQN